MARHARSVPAGPDSVRLRCRHCDLEWNQPRRRGQVPRYCSDACKQAAYRSRTDPAQARDRRRAAEAEATRRARLHNYRILAASLDSRNRLDIETAIDLVFDMAEVFDPDADVSLKTAYRRASRNWHPDLPDGNMQAFQLLQHAREIILLAEDFDI